MDKFTIYCTPEQTRRAYELGAPIDTSILYRNLNIPIDKRHVEIERFYVDKTNHANCKLLKIPTAEQMIGWLRDSQGIDIDKPSFRLNYGYSVSIYNNGMDINIIHVSPIDSNMIYRQATIAAIDAALDYLEKGE